MFKHIVYLDKSKNLLLIASCEIKNNDYFELYKTESDDNELALQACKSFCFGLITAGYCAKPINNREEFN